MLGCSPSLAHARTHALVAQAHVFLVGLGLPDGCGEGGGVLLRRTAAAMAMEQVANLNTDWPAR